MSDKPNIPENLTPVDNSFLNNANLDILKSSPNYEWNIPKQVIDIIEPPSMEEKLKPITDRQDKTIKTLEEQIDVYKIKNQSLQAELEKVNSHLSEETARLKQESLKRELAEAKLNAKDWKVMLISGVIGLVTGLICSWFGVWLTLK